MAFLPGGLSRRPLRSRAAPVGVWVIYCRRGSPVRLLAGNFTQASAGDTGRRQDVWQVSQWFPAQPGILNKIDTALALCWLLWYCCQAAGLALGRGEVCECVCVCVCVCG